MPSNRKSFRYRPEYKEWQKVVKERDKGTCRRCGFKKNIQAHHIRPVETHPEFVFDVNNGLSLCGNCHSELKWKENEIDIERFIEEKEFGRGESLEVLRQQRLRLSTGSSVSDVLSNTAKSIRDEKIKDLIDLMDEKYDTEVRRVAAIGLSDEFQKVDSSDATPELMIAGFITALKDTDDEIYRIAADTLVNFGESAIDPLIRILADRDSRNFYTRAKETLVRIGADNLPRFIETLQHENALVRSTIAQVLGEIGESLVENSQEDICDSQIVTELEKVTRYDNNKSVRKRASEALGKIGTRKALEVQNLFYRIEERRTNRERAIQGVPKVRL